MKMVEKLNAISERFANLEEKLSDPEVIADVRKYAHLHKEYKSLMPLMEAHKAYQKLAGNIHTATEMLEESDAEMRAMAQEELDALLPEKEEMEEQIRRLLIPRDPDDERDVILEIRSGTGGDEASIFAGDLYRMYTKYFESQGWKTEILYINEGTVGGYNKIVVEVSGDEVYGKL
jgi:peptide chain release factor 1